jgi:transposase
MVMTRVESGLHSVAVSERAKPEVSERATRRVFSAQYKLRILAEYERRDRNGKSVLLRREGLYTSSISEWRKQRDEGALQALGVASGRPPTDPRTNELARLRHENVRLQSELATARRVIEVQGNSQRCWNSSPPAARTRRLAASRRDDRSGDQRIDASDWHASSVCRAGVLSGDLLSAASTEPAARSSPSSAVTAAAGAQ